MDPAEADRIGFHAIGKIQSIKNKKSKQQKYQDVFGDWIVDMANSDKNLIGITPAMREGSGLLNLVKNFLIDIMTLQLLNNMPLHLLLVLQQKIKKPVVAIYSTFLQRAYDQLIHDVAVQNLDVTFALDRSVSW